MIPDVLFFLIRDQQNFHARLIARHVGGAGR
jgi:hypothetical protein